MPNPTAEAAENGPPSSKKSKKSAKIPKLTMKRNTMVAALTALFAVVGVLLLVSYMKGAGSEVAADAAAQQDVVITTSPIVAGTTLESLLTEQPARLAVTQVPIDVVPSGALTSLLQLEELQEAESMMVNVDLTAGEQLLISRLAPTTSFSQRVAPVAVPADHHQVTLSLPAERALGGNIRPGDSVSVVGSFQDNLNRSGVTTIVVPAVEVVNVQVDSLSNVGEATADADAVALAPKADYLITIAVTSDELTRVSYTTEFGKVVLGASNETTGTDDKNTHNLQSILNVDVQAEVPDPLAFVDEEPAVGEDAEG